MCVGQPLPTPPYTLPNLNYKIMAMEKSNQNPAWVSVKDAKTQLVGVVAATSTSKSAPGTYLGEYTLAQYMNTEYNGTKYSYTQYRTQDGKTVTFTAGMPQKGFGYIPYSITDPIITAVEKTKVSGNKLETYTVYELSAKAVSSPMVVKP